MRTLLLIVCMCCILPVQPIDVERYAFCESCLGAAREIEKAMKEAPAEMRQTVVKNLIGGGVCEKLQSYNHGHVSKDRMKSSCMRLLDSHHDQFYEALLNKEPKRLDIVLCYEQSPACVGVKRKSFEVPNEKAFRDSDIEALLQANKDKVRIAQPTHSGSPEHSRDEL